MTRLFESLEKKTNSSASIGGKDEPESPRSESKTRILAQSFEARSGNTSPSDSNSSNKNRISRFNQHNRHHNWDAGSVSSGVSSDYPDTDPGSAQPCTSSEDEEIDCQVYFLEMFFTFSSSSFFLNFCLLRLLHTFETTFSPFSSPFF